MVAELSARGRDLALFVEEAAGRARDRIIAGEVALIPIAQRLIELRGELGRAFSRRLHLELAVIAHCGPPTAARQGPLAPQETPPTQARPTPRDPEQPLASGGEPAQGWEAMLEALLAERPAVAAFLAPAAATWADGLLTVRLPPDRAYHYEALQDPKVRAYVEQVAHRFFNPLLAVEIVWEGKGEKPSLEEGARVLAEALEGRVVREVDHG